MDIKTEIKLIEAAKKNPQSFSLIFQEYHPQIFRYVLRRVGIVTVAEDIVSETFFKAIKNLWQFKWRGFPFSSWLYRIAGNEIKKYYRDHQYEAFSLEYLCEEGIIEPADSIDLVEELKEAEALLETYTEFLAIQKILFQLPFKYQEVLSLRFFEDKKLTEISQITGKRMGTIKSLISRGLVLLKKKVQNEKITMQLSLSTRIIESRRAES